MPTDVVMPQMGESIFEGTITKWLKKVGDAVEKDEPLFEISTDKVDAEIPSTVTGILRDIKVQEGETVQINTVVAVIADAVGEVTPVKSRNLEQQPPEPSPAPVAQLAPPQVAQGSGGIEVVMPQMGESIFEGTITKWLKKTGDTVQKDEPLFEISTDKVDAEIPSPVSGVLTQINIDEGATVQINTVVAVIGGAAGAESVAAGATAVAQPDGSSNEPPVNSLRKTQGTEDKVIAAPPEPLAPTQVIRSSPLVRRMAREHNLDLRRITGTGSNGRVNKDDVLAYMKNGGAAVATRQADLATTAPQAPPAPQQMVVGKLEPMSRMRGIIAQRMVESRKTSPHAYSIYKVDMTRVVRLREHSRAGFQQRHGVKLTYMPFIAAAAIDALRRFQIVNASLEGNAIRYHDHIHLGIAVALEWGLIVPVIREAEHRSFRDLAVAIADLADRARTKKLKPEEASGSTFTLTNSGVFGGEYGTPIINQPESAILAIGGLRKEPVVLTDSEGNDAIAIRSMQQYCLGFDHRTIDGADAGRFMTAFKDALEKWNTPIE
jgi:pyruvate dehydrogenase E2 component (dihydrolipoamide acetyltransferase)